VAARLGRTVTIATGLFTALVGITGTVTAATLGYKTSAQQLASEKEKSATEFLRSQRQAAYTAFASEVNATYLALVDANNRLFPPNEPPPTFEDFDRADRDLESHIEKLASTALNMELVASEDVCDAAKREADALNTALDHHFGAAQPYVTGRKPPDDDYRKISMTEKDVSASAKEFTVFIRAAREDLTESRVEKARQELS
jgi:hypothetical protein